MPAPAAKTRRIATAIAAFSIVVGLASAALARASEADASPVVVRVLIVNAFGFEAAPWQAALGPTRRIRVPGLPAEAPDVDCTPEGLCRMTTGMGHANAAASMMAVLYGGQLDLTRAYFLIAGIAGIDPARGTIGSVAWARYAVDTGLAHEIDAREAPPRWKDGYFGILTSGPGEKPRTDYHTEVFELARDVTAAAYALSKDTVLADAPDVAAYRMHYREPTAHSGPKVLRCDTASADTWWGGRRLGDRTRRWTTLLTDGRGDYCTTQQEDNATLVAIARAERDGRAHLSRVAILRAGSDFDRPFPGQSVYASMLAQRALAGAGPIAVENLVRAGMPVARAISTHWDAWSDGVPTDARR